MDAREFRTRLKQKIEDEIGKETEHLLDQVERDFKEAHGAGTFSRAMKLNGMRHVLEIADEMVKEIYGSPTGKA